MQTDIPAAANNPIEAGQPEVRGAPLQVLLLLGTSAGGTARHVRALAASLVQAGHRVTVAAPAAVIEAVDLRGSGAQITAVEVRERPHPRVDARAVTTIRHLAQDVQVVHAHGLRAGGLAVLALRRRPIPLVVTLHNALLAQGVAGSPVRAAYAVLERLVARGAHVVLGVSPDLQERLRALGAPDVRHAVVPAPAASSARPDTDLAQLRAELGVTDRLLVLCVARLAEQKGLPLLLDAVAALPPQLRGPDGPLFFVAGDGPLRDRLLGRIQLEDLPVRLLGWRDDIPDLLATADLVVSSAVWEGQPIALQQALQVGAPVLATKVGGTAAVTGTAARLVPGGDAQAFGTALGELILDPEARAELRERSRVRAAQLPSRDDARDAVLTVYRDVLSRRRP